jgi:hypothetical protein
MAITARDAAGNRSKTRVLKLTIVRRQPGRTSSAQFEQVFC